MFMIFLDQLHRLEGVSDGCVANIISIQLVISDTLCTPQTFALQQTLLNGQNTTMMIQNR